MRWTDGTRQARLAFVADLIALPLFVIVGMGSHREGGELAVFARNAVPIVACWLVASRGLKTYRPPGLGRMIATWAVAVPAALVIRTAIAGQLGNAGVVVFFGVALAFTLLFLGIGRAVALALGRLWGTA